MNTHKEEPEIVIETKDGHSWMCECSKCLPTPPSQIEEQLDNLLVELWNDIANRQAGKIIFEDAKDIMQVRTEILKMMSAQPDYKPSNGEEQL